jgi:putative transposase
MKPLIDESEFAPTTMPDFVPQTSLKQASDEISEAEPPILDLHPETDLPLKHDSEAKLFGRFCCEVMARLDASKAKLVEWRRITEDYNAGRLVPDLLRLKGTRSERTLRIWLQTYLEHNCDMFALVHKGNDQTRERKVTWAEQNYLLSLLLTPKRIRIGTAILHLKRMAGLGLLESPSSVKTLTRWCQDWAADNPAVWAQARNGSKFVSEHIIKSIIRDDSLLSVGDVWVADGHKLAFDVINPTTGRPVRMLLILVIDWASRYPVGASLAVSEDSQHVQTAFRNGFLNWGGLPRYVYLDNGKAFKAKLFNEQWEQHDLVTELGGIFPRLGIGVSFAQAYNARAKVIERFFKTFQEQFERFISTFRGASIADKPATLMRNEKWARKVFESTPPTVEETMAMIGFYFRHVYGEIPHGGLQGRTPFAVYSAATIPEERKVDPSNLNFMMLTAERKRVRSEGIRLNHCLYWHDSLVDHIGKPVVIRFDYADARWILVYSQQDRFICQAELRRAQHPFIKLDPDNPTAHKELQREYQQIKRLQKHTEQRTKQVVKRTQEAVDRIIQPLRLPAETGLFLHPTVITAPVEPAKLLVPEVPVESEHSDEPKEKTFAELLKAIGIK